MAGLAVAAQALIPSRILYFMGLRTANFAEVDMAHTIQFRRPETKWSVSRMSAPTESSTVAQIRNLERLGYTILDISPALVGQCSLQWFVRQV
jgi:hypothetical protein